MKRVAALCLPMWPLDRLRQAGRTAAPPERARAVEAAPPLRAPAQHEGHWRPGARWAREGEAPTLAPTAAAAMLPPLVTSIREGNRVLVAAACLHAQALGIRPGMALTQARAQTPGLDIRPADPEGDRAALHRLAVLAARHWSPVVAVEGDDTLFLDLTGTAHLFGGEEAMARRIVRILGRLGHAARIAVADTAGAAWALAHFGRGQLLVCPPGGQADALAGLPVEALRIDPAAVELLRRLGVDRIGQLAAMPRGPLVRRFGKPIALRLDQALAISEPLDPVVAPEAIVAVQRFAEPILTAEAIAHWLEALVARIVAALAEAGQGARGIELVADRIDGVPQRIRIGLARPSRDAAHLQRLLVRRIEQVEPGFGIDALALHVRRADPLGPEPMTERLDEVQSAPDLAPLVDTLATRIGLGRLMRKQPVESDVPERSVARMSVLDPPERPGARTKVDDVRQLDRNPGMPPWDPRWPRPARLLHRPERLDHVLAELPDHAPRRFTWRGRAYRVVRSDGPERIHGEWWKHLAEAPQVRDYFRVEDEQGHRYWLFRRGDGERAVTGDLSWYLHGVFG